MSRYDQVEALAGSPNILGTSFKEGLCNFALFSSRAKEVILGLFEPKSKAPSRTIPMQRTGDIWHTALKKLPEDSLYAFQCHGDWNENTGDLFNPDQWLLDPYAKILDTSPVWGFGELPFIRAVAKEIPLFDWEGTSRPHIPKQDLIIYEMHVRGFTIHSSADIHPGGTYSAMIEKIPHLKELGINAVELMPIFEFDECHSKNFEPDTNRRLPNYWGYNPLSFFAPKRSFGTISEFKTLVKELHKNGIEVLLDVVYNHTGEGKEKEYAISFRGIDNRVYYLVDLHGKYLDYTGCGNTINANHPIVEDLILQSLRYWAEEMHVDGFRFDLASILTRGTDGKVHTPSPILQKIAADPVLSKLKLISESWDAAGLYQVGSFPKWGPWMEWNGQYRDIARRFIKGTDQKAGPFASILSGSDFLYRESKTPLASINFITAHDGFSMHDLVTYQSKHNWANGEQNHDGNSQNDNWNCGTEGETNDPNIINLRERQMRNHLLALFLSQGIPMLLMGDEYGHTRNGNNNPYVQDDELNWFLWNKLAKHRDIFEFVKGLIAFRKAHPELRRDRFLTEKDVSWHGHQPNHPDWSDKSRFVAFSTKTSARLYIAFNADSHPADIELPDGSWTLIVDTKDGWDKHSFSGNGAKLPGRLQMQPYSALIMKES